MREIPLTQGQVAIVDDEDYEELSRYKWYALWDTKGQCFYAVRHDNTGMKPATIYMHRVILNCKPGEQGDHVHHDTLDNRRSELRICTHGENHQNENKRRGCTSAFKGVYWEKRQGRWRAQARMNGHKYCLGAFADERAAAIAYDCKARELFGEFALTNF